MEENGFSALRLRTAAALLAAVVVTAACGGTVALSPDFPTPMTNRLPLTAQVQYPESLRDFSHVEEAMDTTRWTVALGRPSIRMLNGVLGSCLTLVQAGDSGTVPDLIIQPEILRFEFGVPGRSKVDVPAAWVEFDIRITGGDGSPLTTLKIPGYGEGSSGSGGMGRRLSEAAEYALRDAGATLTQEISQDSAILALVGSKS